jgi:hypothetical protein
MTFFMSRILDSARAWAFFSLMGLVGVFGCSGASKGLVNGTVTYKDKPVNSGTITFFDAKGTGFQGTITNGSYIVPDVTAGEVKICVSSPRPSVAGGGGRGMAAKNKGTGGPNTADWTKLPEKYERPETTDLKFTVKGGENNHPIVLTD